MPFRRYRNLVVTNPLPAPAPGEFAAVERELGVALPEAPRGFLAAAHGARVDFVVDAAEAGEVFCLGGVFLLAVDAHGKYGYGTLLGELRAHRHDRRLPPGVLPFAQGDGDVWQYLDLTPEGGGRVVGYFEGMPFWAGGRSESAYLTLAPSLNEYLDALRPDEDDSVDNLRHALRHGRADAVAATVEFLDLALPGWEERHPDLAAQAAALVAAGQRSSGDEG